MKKPLWKEVTHILWNEDDGGSVTEATLERGYVLSME